MIYLREGSIDEVVGQDVLGLEPGMFVVHPPGTEHGDLAHSEYFLYHVMFTSDHPSAWPRVGCDLDGSPLGALLGMIVHDWHNGWAQREAFLRHSAQMLDIVMKRCGLFGQEGRTAQAIVAQARGLFRRGFRQPIDMGEIAAELGISRSTLYAHFRSVLGRTPQSVVAEMRLRNALFLLQHSKLSVAEIARGSGYCSASHLGRKLREAYNLGAKDIRAQSVKP